MCVFARARSQVFGSWLGAYLSTYSAGLPVLISCAVMFVNMGCIAYECGPAGAGPTRTWRRQLERQHSLRRRRMQQHRAKEE